VSKHIMQPSAHQPPSCLSRLLCPPIIHNLHTAYPHAARCITATPTTFCDSTPEGFPHYLVLIVHANTKYSINNLFRDFFSCDLPSDRHTKNVPEITVLKTAFQATIIVKLGKFAKINALATPPHYLLAIKMTRGLTSRTVFKNLPTNNILCVLV
jgi:hypothetical protein